MIAINKNQANTVVVTVKDKITLSMPYYLFAFKSDDTNIWSYCIGAPVVTTWEDRSKFTITEQASPNPVLGQIQLKSGDYHYYIYEQASSTNLDPTGLNEVSKGLATCYDIPVVNKEYSVSLENKSYG